jgi:hypothetical protein
MDALFTYRGGEPIDTSMPELWMEAAVFGKRASDLREARHVSCGERTRVSELEDAGVDPHDRLDVVL